MTAPPLLRAGTFDLEILPTGFSQPQPELEKGSRERAEDPTACTDAVPRCALRPDCIFEAGLQHVVVLVRRRVLRRYARKHSGAHGREKIENVRGLRFFGVDDGCVTGGRVRTCSNGVNETK
jgi:hypothetical protein